MTVTRDEEVHEKLDQPETFFRELSPAWWRHATMEEYAEVLVNLSTAYHVREIRFTPSTVGVIFIQKNKGLHHCQMENIVEAVHERHLAKETAEYKKNRMVDSGSFPPVKE